MLEGLEISEINSLKAFNQTVTHRIDPEYFWKQHLNDEKIITSRPSDFCSMADLGITVNASAFYPSIEAYYGEGTLPFLRVADVDKFVDYERCTTIPEKLCSMHPTLAKVSPGDILFTKGGSIARIGLVTNAAAASRDLIFLNSSTLSEEDQVFLYLYFQTGFFNRALIRSGSQTAQPHLTITLVRELRSLLASDFFKVELLRCVKSAFHLRSSSIQIQKDNESLLLNALELDICAPLEALSYVRSSREAFSAGRLDAEFFAPHVKLLLQRLGRDGLHIGDVAPARHERFEPEGGGMFDYIEIGSVGTDGTASADTLPIIEAPSRATQYVRAGDVITSTVRPVRRLSALIASHQDGDVCSSGFVVLQPKRLSGEVLLTYLRLPLVCELMDLHTSATMYPAISETDLLALPVPVIAPAIQEKIQAGVQLAAHQRTLALTLLDAAKRAVEIAIEDSESAALAYMENIV